MHCAFAKKVIEDHEMNTMNETRFVERNKTKEEFADFKLDFWRTDWKNEKSKYLF